MKPTRERRGRPPKLDRDRVTPRKAPKPPAAAAAPSICADALAAPPVPVPVAVQQVSDPHQQQQQQPCALAQTALVKLEQVVTAEVPSALLSPTRHARALGPATAGRGDGRVDRVSSAAAQREPAAHLGP